MTHNPISSVFFVFFCGVFLVFGGLPCRQVFDLLVGYVLSGSLTISILCLTSFPGYVGPSLLISGLVLTRIISSEGFLIFLVVGFARVVVCFLTSMVFLLKSCGVVCFCWLQVPFLSP